MIGKEFYMPRKRRAIMPPLAVFVLLSSVMAVPIIWLSPSAGAASCGTAEVTFDGTNVGSQNVYYVQSNITTNVPTLCGASNSHSSAWTMIQGSAGSGGYAQSGYIRLKGYSTAHMFAEYNEYNSGSFHFKEGAAAPSGAPLYYESYDFSAGDIQMVVDTSTLLLTTDFDPELVWTTPWVPEWEGETHHTGDNMPGTASARTYFSSMLVTTSRGGGAVTPSGLTVSVSNPGTNYGVAWDTVDSKFDIWTK
jgi:hypothetical protein